MSTVIWFFIGLSLGLLFDWILVKLMLKKIEQRLSHLEERVWRIR
jgi:hypothetical protein